MNRTRLLVVMAVFVAIGTLGSQFLWFPAGIAKAYPVQHAVNVMAAVIVGPIPAIGIACVIGIMRVMLGLGTLLAFPGGMIGALLAGVLYQWTNKTTFAAVGEVIGTGVIGALVAVPYAQVLMGSSAGAFAFLSPFFVSSVSGAFIGLIVVSKLPSHVGNIASARS
ncbi:energy coupling factor transporter S component ThiW [Halobacillus litoralis]|uniref:energy coupling factor transporter S component ThiW n=1 Tax=Halobacillus litoralis TaxID=45668 RepID=UPI001CD719AE|nr:energy coupling factor transporter S component ThiW [Halobacillus litoralis]MCA0969434.1 energy coupling factor transporter S component ThiW [Halobacillus litoralis]